MLEVTKEEVIKMSTLLAKISGQEILPDSSLFEAIQLAKTQNEQRLVELNLHYRTNADMRAELTAITGRKIDPSVVVSQPFYSDFGKHIQFGKQIFINQNVTFVDLGGITLADQVLIGPNSRLITVNHLASPDKRRGLSVQPIKIQKNAWLGANVTVLPGVVIGENAIVAADATVTKDVPANTIVAGSPARIIKTINS